MMEILLGRKKSGRQRPPNMSQTGFSKQDYGNHTHNNNRPEEPDRNGNTSSAQFGNGFGQSAAPRPGGPERDRYCSSSHFGPSYEWGTTFDHTNFGHSAAPHPSCQQGNAFRSEAGRGSNVFYSAPQAPPSHQAYQGGQTGHGSARSHHYQPNPQDAPSTSDQFHRSDPDIRLVGFQFYPGP